MHRGAFGAVSADLTAAASEGKDRQPKPVWGKQSDLTASLPRVDSIQSSNGPCPLVCLPCESKGSQREKKMIDVKWRDVFVLYIIIRSSPRVQDIDQFQIPRLYPHPYDSIEIEHLGPALPLLRELTIIALPAIQHSHSTTGIGVVNSTSLLRTNPGIGMHKVIIPGESSPAALAIIQTVDHNGVGDQTNAPDNGVDVNRGTADRGQRTDTPSIRGQALGTGDNGRGTGVFVSNEDTPFIVAGIE